MRENPEEAARRLLRSHPPYLAMRHAQERLHSHPAGSYSWKWWAAVCEALRPRVGRPKVNAPSQRHTMFDRATRTA